jgi:predicted dehydrogenase
MAKQTGKGRTLRMAFIGAGGIAGAHMKHTAGIPGVEFVGVADVVKEAAEKRGDEFSIPNRYTDYQQMLREQKPDAVSVCTPNGMHAPATIAALEAGAHVIVEKPMAMNAKEAQAMIDVARKRDRKLVIGFQWRFSSAAQFLRKQVSEGRFGDVMYVRAQALRRRGIPNWGVFGRKELQGGGPLIDIGVHIMEVAHFVMGSPKPVAATGQTWTYMGHKKSNVVSNWPNWDYKTYNVEDLAVGQIRFENGAIMTVESSFVIHGPGVFNFQIMGEKAGANFDPPQMFHDQGGYMMDSTPGYLPKSDFQGNFKLKMEDFVAHCMNDQPTMAPAEHGLMIQKMLDGLYASAEKGREVAIEC